MSPAIPSLSLRFRHSCHKTGLFSGRNGKRRSFWQRSGPAFVTRFRDPLLPLFAIFRLSHLPDLSPLSSLLSTFLDHFVSVLDHFVTVLDYPVLVHLLWYTCLVHPILHHSGYTCCTWSGMLSVLHVRGPQQEDVLGSEASCSLGACTSRGNSAQSPHASSRVENRRDRTRKRGIGQRLEGRREEWLIFTLEMELMRESWIPGIPQFFARETQNTTVFTTFVDFARGYQSNHTRNHTLRQNWSCLTTRFTVGFLFPRVNSSSRTDGFLDAGRHLTHILDKRWNSSRKSGILRKSDD